MWMTRANLCLVVSLADKWYENRRRIHFEWIIAQDIFKICFLQIDASRPLGLTCHHASGRIATLSQQFETSNSSYTRTWLYHPYGHFACSWGRVVEATMVQVKCRWVEIIESHKESLIYWNHFKVLSDPIDNIFLASVPKAKLTTGEVLEIVANSSHCLAKNNLICQ